MIREELLTLENTGRKPNYVPGVVIIKIKKDLTANVPRAAAGKSIKIAAARLPQAAEAPLDYLRRKNHIRGITPFFTKAGGMHVASHAAHAFAASVDATHDDDLKGVNFLHLTNKSNAREICKDLERHDWVEYVEPSPARWLTAKPAKPKFTSGDPLVFRQWGLRAIQWFEADPNKKVKNAHLMKVGVLDTGIDENHPDLSGQIDHYYHDGVSGADIIGHGTHVSGIIAANPTNKVGIAGITKCKLNVWKIFTDDPNPEDGEFYVDDILYNRALNAAREQGMNVINLSIGGGASSSLERKLFKKLIDAGTTVVAAMGNEFKEGNPIEFPGAYPGVIAVGAIDPANRRAGFSNTGKHISISAPGVQILSTLPMTKSSERKETKYAAWDGTSMATPHVTAAASLVLAKSGGLSPAQVKARLTKTATSVDGTTREVGAGLLNLAAALS